MATSAIEVCKLALARVGNTNFFIAFTDGSVEANVAAMEYPQIRDLTLERLAPSFATKRATLNLLADANSNWDYVYALPSDFLAIQEIVSPYGRFISQDLKDKFDIEVGSTGVRVLLCNTPDVEIIYTFRNENVGSWPPSFTEAVVMGLTARFAASIKKDYQLARMLQDEYDNATARANTSAEVQRQYGAEYESATIRARN